MTQDVFYQAPNGDLIKLCEECPTPQAYLESIGYVQPIPEVSTVVESSLEVLEESWCNKDL